MFSTLISAANLRKKVLAAADVVIFDCRFRLGDPEAGRILYGAGHLAGAHYLHLDTDLAGPITDKSGRHPLPDPAALRACLRDCGVNEGQQIICYDDMGGAFAARLWWLCHWLGHEAVAVLDGGLDAWTIAGGELTTEPPASAPGDFDGQPNNDRWIDLERVQAALAEHQITLLDARTHDRFTARDTTTDPVCGHIPGARSAPFAENLQADGTFKPPNALRERFSAWSDATPVMMCGSGVTACHNLLAMRHAGLPWAPLYVGSWSEWIRDPTRPVATGSE